MAKWQFSTWNLLLSITLLGCALAILPLFPKLLGLESLTPRSELFVFTSLCVAFMGLMGAGVGAIFRKSGLGALGGATIGAFPGALYAALAWALWQFQEMYK